MKINFNKIIITVLIFLCLLMPTTLGLKVENKNIAQDLEYTDNLSNFNIKSIDIMDSDVEDFDPNCNIELTFTLNEIRPFDTIDKFSNPDFYVKVYVNGEVHTSKTWKNTKYVKNPDWSFTVDVPDNKAIVNIQIELWDQENGKDKLCDISGDYVLTSDSKTVELTYDISSGHWWGDDFVSHYPDWDARGDPSGYGRLNGCDDKSEYQEDLDCELWFDITQTDPDGDTIPYWTEVNVYNTDPTVDNTGEDFDEDGVPIEWEYKWGHYAGYERHSRTWKNYFIFDPLTWEDHDNFDYDLDGIDNVEEYKAAQDGMKTDPFRRDILLEIDQMQFGPNGEGALVPELSKDLLWDSFGKHNIVFQIDDHGQVIPFDWNTSGWNGDEMQNIYHTYFLNGNTSHWRRGAFHYAPIVYRSDDHPGNMFYSIVGDWDGIFRFNETINNEVSLYGDCFQVSTKNHEQLQYKHALVYRLAHKTFNKEKQRAIVYATAMMHETGHVLGIFSDNVPGCDNASSVNPWQKGFWVWRNYRSCMNYGKMYRFVDYSNGQNGKNDFDDWSNIDLTLFQVERNPFYQN